MTATTVDPHKSSIGDLDANIMALIAYIGAAVIGWIPFLKYFAWLFPLVLFFIETKSTFVKFHAMQAFILNVVGAVLVFIMTVVIGGSIAVASYGNPLAGAGAVLIVGVIAFLISAAITIFSIIALYNAYMYRLYYIPVIGKFAENMASKLGKK